MLLRKNTKLIMTRHLGHRLEQPLSTKWRLLTEPHEKCWICDRHHYAIVFWSPDIAAQTQELGMNQEDRERLVEDVEKLNQDITSEDLDGPAIAGSFTGWRFQPMMQIYDLCDAIDSTFKKPYVP